MSSKLRSLMTVPLPFGFVPGDGGFSCLKSRTAVRKWTSASQCSLRGRGKLERKCNPKARCERNGSLLARASAVRLGARNERM